MNAYTPFDRLENLLQRPEIEKGVNLESLEYSNLVNLLSEREIVVFLHLIYYGETVNEVAQHLNITKSAVYLIVKSLRRKIKKILGGVL